MICRALNRFLLFSDHADILEALVVIVSIFTLAEANVYALRSNYFRLFHTYEEGDWRVHESFGYKCILFFHSFFSIGEMSNSKQSLPVS